ncbi:hypothetical protein O9993_18030 [Vibrio lentus]|nr:hypothetical protein [Vibrio lentus]
MIDLNFVGYETGPGGSPDLSTKPIYEANITEAGKTRHSHQTCRLVDEVYHIKVK